MSSRLNLFLYGGIIALVIAGYGNISIRRIVRQSEKQQAANNETQMVQMKEYLAKQTDARKMVRLSLKLAPSGNKALTQAAIDRAYELKNNSRDIALLDSYFHPELKQRVVELDPLYEMPEPTN